MEARSPLSPRVACLTSKEKLADRFLVTGTVPKEPGSGPVLLYSLEVTRPWFSESQLVPTITQVLATRYEYIEHSNNPLKSFEAALKNVNDELFALTERGETDWLGHVNALIVLIDNDEVHIAQTGNATAYLFRQRKISQVTDDTQTVAEPHPLNTFANIISGQVAEGDRLVFSNQDLFSLVSLDQIRAAVTDQTPFVAATQIVKNIRRQKITSVSSIIVAIETLATWKRAGEEPTTVSIEDVLQSWYKTVWKKTKPVLVKVGAFFKVAWKKTKVTGSHAKERWQTSYGPKTKTFLRKSAASVSHVTQSATARTKVALSKATSSLEQRAKPAFSATTMSRADGWLTTTLQPVSAVLFPLRAPLERLDGQVERLGGWLQPYIGGKNTRYAIVAFALVVLITSINTVRLRRASQITDANISQNEAALATVDDQLAKIDSDLKLQQDVEAQNLLASAAATLKGLHNLTPAQSSRRDAAAALLTTKSDTLTKTSRPPVAVKVDVDAATTTLAASEKGVFALTAAKPDGSFTSADVAKTKTPFTLSDKATPLDATYSPDTDETIVLTSNKAIDSVRKENDSVTVTKRQNPLGDFAEAKRIAVFNNNIYLLDPNNGLLWKYARSGDNYSRGISQADQADINLTGAKDLTIDGYIYVLQKDGTLVKLLRGKPEQDFVVANLPKTVDPATFVALTTADSTESLFVLSASSTGARVVVLDKKGNYQKQYAFSEPIDHPTDIAYSSKDKRLWITGDGLALAVQL